MALPKEPRQKMINMMYLVLTALLALNVSSEILNAFKTVNNSLTKSNSLIDESNKGVSAQLAAMLEDPNTRMKAEIWKPKADSALAISQEVSAYISDLKQKLLVEAGLKDDGTYKEDNLMLLRDFLKRKVRAIKLFEKLKKV
jgi:gliding motility-associated protein GldM